MLKYNRLLLATLALTLTLNAQKIKEDSSNYTTKIIKQNGVVKKINIPNNKYRSQSSQYGIIIKFSDNEGVDIQEFAAKYDLLYESTLSIGYYILRNSSTINDYDLIETIITNENNIHTIKQNAPLKAKML